MAFEAARAQQSGIEYAQTIGSGKDDDPCPRIETIHLNEKLVQCTLQLVMPAHGVESAGFAECIPLIQEDNAGSMLLGLLEMDAAGPQSQRGTTAVSRAPCT